MPFTINIFWINSPSRPLEDLITELYGPDASLGPERMDFLKVAHGKRPAAAHWNDAYWIFDRKRAVQWAISDPVPRGKTLSAYLDPARNRYGYTAREDGEIIAARHGKGKRIDVISSAKDRGYEHRMVSDHYWKGAPPGAADIITSGGILPKVPPEKFRRGVVLTALQTYTGPDPFGEDRRHFQGVPVRRISRPHGWRFWQQV